MGLLVVVGLVVRDGVGRRVSSLAVREGWTWLRFTVVAEAIFLLAVAFVVALGRSGVARRTRALDDEAKGVASTDFRSAIARRAELEGAGSGLIFCSGAAEAFEADGLG